LKAINRAFSLQQQDKQDSSLILSLSCPQPISVVDRPILLSTDSFRQRFSRGKPLQSYRQAYSAIDMPAA